MGIKSVKPKMIHGFLDVVMKVNLRAVEWLLWVDVSVVYEGFAELRVGLYGFNILRKFHVYIALSLNIRNRSQVHGSTFRVKDKEGIEDPKSSFKMLIFPSNCQFSSKFWNNPYEADVFLIKT